MSTVMHRAKRMRGSRIEVPGMAEESRKVRGDQPYQLPAGKRVAFFCGAEEPLDADGGGEPESPAADGEKLTVAVEQLNARQAQGKFSGPIELFARQHCRSQSQALRPVSLIRSAAIALGNVLRR